MRTYSATPADINKKWVLIDAKDMVVGRLAALIATRLRGKHLPSYTPHMDCGDHVVVINAEKVKLSGKKREDKVYYRHTGYPGGLKETYAGDILDGKNPERVLQMAVKRMLPRGPLARQQLTHLRVYAGEVHPHEAQSPEILPLATANAKNVRA